MFGERESEQNEAVVNQHEYDGDGESDIGLTALHADTQRNADERESKTRERKRHLPMYLHAQLRDDLIELLR